jgi:tryptophanyl-tRNA synthetase
MVKVKTERYELDVKEISSGGPGGYEATYLTSEGDEASDELYSILNEGGDHLLPLANRMIRQRNGPNFVESLKMGDAMGIASGFKPSGAYHFGHKLASSTVSFFQKRGTQVFIPVADLECMLDTKQTKEEYLYWAADNLLDWGANGIDLDASHVYLQSEEHRVSNLAYLLARGLTFASPIDIYGFEKMSSEFPFLFAGITQVGDIALPQHRDFGNKHSFMVSGQDQDGHMKMTSELVARALESGIELPGNFSVPSSFYIPHIRGIIGKASSSKPEATIYLGSGPFKEDLEKRIKTSVDKLELAMKDPSKKSNVILGALDMVRYIPEFNQFSGVDFSVYSPEFEELSSAQIDQRLLSACNEVGQDNVEIILENLPSILKEHKNKRAAVLNYALSRANYSPQGGWAADDFSPTKPSFWDVPENAEVDETKRNRTQWFNLVASVADKLVP